MRILFWILLLGNVILFAVIQRDGFGWGTQGVQAQPYLHGDMIRLLPASPQSPPAKALPAPKPVPVSAMPNPTVAVSSASSPAQVSSTPETSSNPNLLKNMAEPAEVKPGTTVCLEWGEFSGPDLARATVALSAMHLDDKLSQRQIDIATGYWVYIPPLKNKAAVNRKIAELKSLGIREYFVVQVPGNWLNAISLGVFKTREAAQNFLQDLGNKGVHSARVGERASKVKATIFILNRVDAGTLSKLAAMQNDFIGSQLNNVPCTLTR